MKISVGIDVFKIALKNTFVPIKVTLIPNVLYWSIFGPQEYAGVYLDPKSILGYTWTQRVYRSIAPGTARSWDPRYYRNGPAGFQLLS